MRLDDDLDGEGSDSEINPPKKPKKYINDDAIRDPAWSPYRPSRDRDPQRKRNEAPEPTIQVRSAWVVTE